MTVRVDYGCLQCGHREELAVTTPIPTTVCTVCGGTAKRIWTTFGIGRGRSGGADANADRSAAAGGRATASLRGADLCRSNPGVPGLCMLSDSAGRALVARSNNDGRSLEREQQHQTDFLASTGDHGAVVSDHGHSHSGGSGEPAGPGPREIG